MQNSLQHVCCTNTSFCVNYFKFVQLGTVCMSRKYCNISKESLSKFEALLFILHPIDQHHFTILLSTFLFSTLSLSLSPFLSPFLLLSLSLSLSLINLSSLSRWYDKKLRMITTKNWYGIFDVKLFFFLLYRNFMQNNFKQM